MTKQGTIVLVPFPFTDLSATKVRPAVVISAVEHGDDVVLAFISSNVSRHEPFDIKIKNTDRNFNKTGLKGDSLLRIAKLATLDRKIILGELGIWGAEHLKQAKTNLKKLFSI
jgi:mRNA interferase MazF